MMQFLYNTSVTKEQLFSLLQDSILSLKKLHPRRNPNRTLMRDDKGEVMYENPEFYNAWKIQMERVTKEINNLNSCDQLWLSENYSIWHKEVLSKDPEVESLRAKIKLPVN